MGTTRVARSAEAGGCWAAGATRVARSDEAGGCWAAGATKVARLLTMSDALKRVDAAVCLEAPRATGGVERRIIGGFWEVDQGRSWAVEEPYDVASEDVGGLLDFTKPPGAIKGVEPNGGSSRQRSG